MPGGIVWSISASIEGTPMARNSASRAAASGPMWRDWKEPGFSEVIRECCAGASRRYFVSSVYWAASSRSAASPDTFIAIIHESCGAEFTASGFWVSDWLISVTSPPSGA